MLVHAVIVHIYSSIHASIHSSIHLNASISFVQIHLGQCLLASIHPSIICPSVLPCIHLSHAVFVHIYPSHVVLIHIIHPSIHQSINHPFIQPSLHPSLSLVQLLFTYFSPVKFFSDRFIYASCLLLSLGGVQSPMC